jgi:hypothetical protein
MFSFSPPLCLHSAESIYNAGFLHIICIHIRIYFCDLISTLIILATHICHFHACMLTCLHIHVAFTPNIYFFSVTVHPSSERTLLFTFLRWWLPPLSLSVFLTAYTP